MRDWLKIAIVIAAVVFAIATASILLGPYAPQGFGSTIAQSLSIFILALGIVSSTIAVVAGRWYQERFRRQNEEKRIKSALVSYFAGLPVQLVPLASVFHGIAETHFPIPPRDYPAELDTSIPRLVLDILHRASPIDTSYYEKNVKDHLLYLPEPLARQAIAVSILTFTINNYYDSLLHDISSKTVNEKLFPPGRQVSAYITTRGKAHELISQLWADLAVKISQLTRNLLEGQETSEEFRSEMDKIQEVKVELDKAHLEFVKIIFPLPESQSPTSMSQDDPR
jgi:hypothetical protein